MCETMARQMRLTDPTIRSLKAPAEGALIFPDDIIPGFGVRVSEGGTKSFVLTHGPRRKRETIGRVGVVSLTDARAEAKRRLRSGFARMSAIICSLVMPSKRPTALFLGFFLFDLSM